MGSFKEALDIVAKITSVAGEGRRMTTAISNTFLPKKKLKEEIEELKEELRREQRKSQSLIIAIKDHQRGMTSESAYPRRSEWDIVLWSKAEDTLAPNGKMSDHPIKGKNE